MNQDDFSHAGPGLPTTIELSPLEVTALNTLGAGAALHTLAAHYRPTNNGRRGRDDIDSMVGYRQEFEDALAVIQRLADRLYQDQVRP